MLLKPGPPTTEEFDSRKYTWHIRNRRRKPSRPR
jgi:hypothetical protein